MGKTAFASLILLALPALLITVTLLLEALATTAKLKIGSTATAVGALAFRSVIVLVVKPRLITVTLLLP